MKNKKYAINLVLTVIGIILTSIGFSHMDKEMLAYSKVLYTILVLAGLGLLGYNLGEIIRSYMIKKYPREAKKIRIDENDERNIYISNQAKSKAFDSMGFIFGILIIVYVLLKTDIIILFLLIVSYLAVYGIMIYHLYILQRKM